MSQYLRMYLVMRFAKRFCECVESLVCDNDDRNSFSETLNFMLQKVTLANYPFVRDSGLGDAGGSVGRTLRADARVEGGVLLCGKLGFSLE